MRAELARLASAQEDLSQHVIGLHERRGAQDAAVSASALGHESVCWNWIDMVVVAACVCDQWIMPILPDAMTGHALVTFLSLLQTIRLCRIELLKKEIQIIKMMDHANTIKLYEAFEAQVRNNASRQTTQVYGFFDECVSTYSGLSVWKTFTDTFDYLLISTVIENQAIRCDWSISPRSGDYKKTLASLCSWNSEDSLELMPIYWAQRCRDALTDVSTLKDILVGMPAVAIKKVTLVFEEVYDRELQADIKNKCDENSSFVRFSTYWKQTMVALMDIPVERYVKGFNVAIRMVGLLRVGAILCVDAWAALSTKSLRSSDQQPLLYSDIVHSSSNCGLMNYAFTLHNAKAIASESSYTCTARETLPESLMKCLRFCLMRSHAWIGVDIAFCTVHGEVCAYPFMR